MPAANRMTELLKLAQSVMSEDCWPEAIITGNFQNFIADMGRRPPDLALEAKLCPCRKTLGAVVESWLLLLQARTHE
jgi:hypothetical protein